MVDRARMSNRPFPPPLPRSTLLTAFAWVIIGLSALGIPISVISGFMFIAGSYGTQNAEPIGAFVVLVGPTLTLVAGVGLLLRQRWAWWIIVFVLSAIVVSNVLTMIAAETGPSQYVSPEGVPTTALKSGALYLSPILIGSALALAFLLTRRVRMECRVKAPRSFTAQQPPSVTRNSERGWRVGHAGRDLMYYEEDHEGAWRRIDLSGEMLMGRAHHVIYFRSPERWQEYPEWARHRREEIIARIRSEFREPDYEYAEDASAAAIAAAVSAAQRIAPSAALRPTQGMGALILFIAIFLTLGAGMSWLVRSGLQDGATWLATKRASQSRIVARTQEPAMFWTAIGTYSDIALGSFIFAAWLTKEGIQLRRR